MPGHGFAQSTDLIFIMGKQQKPVYAMPGVQW